MDIKETIQAAINDAKAQQEQARELIQVTSGAIQFGEHLLKQLNEEEKIDGSN